MWRLVIGLGRWALAGWGLTEVASEVTDNVKDMTTDVAEASSQTVKGAKNIGLTIAIVFGLMFAIPLIVARLPKKNRKRR